MTASGISLSYIENGIRKVCPERIKYYYRQTKHHEVIIMYRFFDILPTKTFIVFSLIIFFGLIYVIVLIKKKQPGNPMIRFFSIAIAGLLFVMAGKIIVEYVNNVSIQEFFKISSYVINIIILFLLLFIMPLIMCKKGYLTKQKLKKYIPGLLVFIVASILMELSLKIG